jgi:hypothetical protein
LEAIKEKNQIIYKGKHIKKPADFQTETLRPRGAWAEEL